MAVHKIVVAGCVVALPVAFMAAPVSAQDCARFLGPPKTVEGRAIGIETCTISAPQPFESAVGAPFVKLEVGVSGTLDGYTVKDGTRYEMLTDVPDYALAQRQNLGPYYRATGYYRADKGNLLSIFMPKSAADWNGKMWVLVHGMSSYGKVNDLQPRTRDRYNPLMGVNSFAGLMIDKGYVVVHTSRPAARRENGASEAVKLMDGTEMGEKSFGYNASLIKDWTFLARRIVRDQLGSEPERTYFYGKSAGASLGRLINYAPGMNVGPDGKRVFDAILADDAGGGWYMPTLNFRRVKIDEHSFKVERDAQDHLPFDQDRLDALVPQIDLVHQAYVGADFVEGNYLSMKRENAVLLKQKGAGDKVRTYEVVGLSHGDAGNVWPNPRYKENLDLSGIMDALVDMLDGWVEGRIVPPPTRSSDYRVADVDGDLKLDHPAIQLPEVACPLGVYYEFPPGVKTPGSTGFAPFLDTARPKVNADTEPLPAGFDEAWLEPLDSRGRPLDMNGNRVRDTRESVEEAWRRRRIEGERFGTLNLDESFTPEKYALCVIQSASELANQGLLSKAALFHYIESAMKFREGERPAPAPAVSSVQAGGQ
jgi:hypothetical protein